MGGMGQAATQPGQQGARVRLRVGCQFSYENGAPAPAVIQVTPRPGEASEVLGERWEITPAVALEPFTDHYGNRSHRGVLCAGPVVLRYDALVEAPARPDELGVDAPQHPVQELAAEQLHYLLPSRYCLSDEMMSVAWELFGDTPPGWPRAQAISDWVHSNLAFEHGSSDQLTTARQAFERRRGVCRDFAHVFISFCRATNIPSRYVFGYLPDIQVDPPDEPMDFCAWAEVYLGDRWWTFDPRNNQRRIGRVVIGRGRDALDVAMVTSWGPADLRDLVVWADEVER
jgi:transglutaminase-like putative cysteine protease